MTTLMGSNPTASDSGDTRKRAISIKLPRASAFDEREPDAQESRDDANLRADQWEQAKREVQRDLDQAIEKDAADTQSQTQFTELSGHIRKCWDAARRAKQDVQLELYDYAMQRKGEYSEDQLTEINNLGYSTIFMNITNVICRAAESWLRDVATSVNDTTWSIEPTTIPSVSPDIDQYITQYIQTRAQTDPLVSSFDDQKQLSDYLKEEVSKLLMQEAYRAAGRMTMKIQDQLEEAKWERVMNDVRSDIVTYKAGIIKFPVVRKRKRTVWVQDPSTGKFTMDEKIETSIDCDRVSPFDLYPSPYSRDIQDGYLCEHHRLNRQDLLNMIGVPGYDENSIRAALREYENGYSEQGMWADNKLREEAEGRKEEYRTEIDKPIDAIEFWGGVRGRLLLDWGMTTSEIPDPDQEYQVNAWLIGHYIIKAVINQNVGGEKPYHKTSFENIPGSFWGKGIPEIIRPIQEACNATARALVTNLAISSGPQVIVDRAKLDMGTNIEDMYPWKIWYYDSESAQWNTSTAAVDFFQPESNASELWQIFEAFSTKANDYSGIPPYVYGNADVGGVGRTATGFSMLMGNASKGIKFVLANIDQDIIVPCVEFLYKFNMKFDPDDSIKGDLNVVARGAMSLIAKEQLQIRRMEFMQMVGNNPLYTEIVGYKGIAYLLREGAKTLDLPVDKIVPSDREVEYQERVKQEQERMQAELMQAMQGAGMGNAGMGMPGGATAQLSQNPNRPQSTQLRGTLPRPRAINAAGEPIRGTDAATFANRRQGT